MSKVLMKGNEALGEAAIRAGCVHFFGYPITPQTETPEYLVKRLPEVGGALVQNTIGINLVPTVAGDPLYFEPLATSLPGNSHGVSAKVARIAVAIHPAP